jgi:hypothetical protein
MLHSTASARREASARLLSVAFVLPRRAHPARRADGCGMARKDRVAKLADTGGKARAQSRIELRRVHGWVPLEVRRLTRAMPWREAGEP